MGSFIKRIDYLFKFVFQIVRTRFTHVLSYFLFIFCKEEVSDAIPSGLRIALASHYLSRYKRIILWGSGTERTSVNFDALYTDMEYVKIHRTLNLQKTHDLKHYTEILVRAFNATNILTRNGFTLFEIIQA